MAVLVTPLPQLGAVAAPDTVGLSLPSADSLRWHPGLPVSMAKLPGEDLVISANGYDPLRHAFRGTYYRTGGLAPETAATATPTGTQATAVLGIDDNDDGTPYTIADGEQIVIYQNGNAGVISFNTTLPSSPLFPAVKIVSGGTAAQNMKDTLDNLVAFIGQTGTEGVDYKSAGLDYSTLLSASRGSGTPGDFRVTFTVTEYGTVGNSRGAELWSGTWSDSRFGSNGTSVGSGGGTFTGGANGSGTAPEAGSYRYVYTHIRTDDGAETGASPIVTAEQGTAQEIDIDALVASDDTTFDYLRIYRTEDTGEEFFRVGEVARALSGSPDFTDDVPNGEDDFSLQGFGAAAYDFGAFLNYRGGFPPRGRVVEVWRHRVWTGGAVLAADYSAGTADVTNDSDEVTLSSTAAPTESMVGDTFVVDDDAETYSILKVNESTRVLTLDRAYQGTTDSTADYTIKDLRDPTQIHCSEPNLPNQWPARNNPGSVDTDGDDEGITGMVGLDDALIVFTRTTMSRVTGDDLQSWQVHRILGGKGCVAGASIQRVSLGGSTGIVWLSPEGIMLYGGSGAPVNLSSPSADSGLDGTLDRINWAHAHLAHSRYSDDQRVVEIYVPMDDDVTPRSAIVLDLASRTFMGPDRVPDLTASSVVIGLDGKRLGIAGSRNGAIWQLDMGSKIDGGHGSHEPVQAVTGGATVRGVTRDTGTDWPTSGDGLDWTPVLVVYADGSYQDNIIASNTDNDLTFAYDLDAAPADQDQVSVGCIHGIAESGWVMLSDGFDEIRVRRLVVLHSPESSGSYHPSMATSQAALDVPGTDDDYQTGDFSDTSGRRFFNWRGRGLLHKFALHVVDNGIDAAFIGYGYDAETREAR